MKSLFSDNRAANILQAFRRNSVLRVSALAQKFGVSERTIRNDIKQLNTDLEGSAVITGEQGKYSLRVYDNDQFRIRYVRISETDGMFNTPQNRMDYVFGQLMRSPEPLLTDELAYEMNIGRTTLIGDLKKLRSDISSYGLTVVGKTSKGLLLHGNEFDIRRYVLENNYEAIYRDYPLDREISDMLEEAGRKSSLSKNVKKQFRQYITITLDRFLTGHFIGRLPEKYYNLTARKEFSDIDSLMNRIGVSLHTEIPVEEKLFIFMPIIGMRTPADLGSMYAIELDERVQPIIRKIFDEIQNRLDIAVDMERFSEEFQYHMMFMLNRLRFRVRLDTDHMDDEIRHKFPLAYQMAGIAAEVISEAAGLTVPEEERILLTTYFGVYLAESNMNQFREFRVAVVSSSGRISSRLIMVQLRKILDHGVEIDMYSGDAVDEELLDSYSIVLTTEELSVPCSRPVIRIREIFNEQELRHKIEKAKYWDKIDVPMMDNNWFIMAGLLDESRFFVLDQAASYEEGIAIMADSLAASGQVDMEFGKRLAEREERGTMVFDHQVAIPHHVQYAADKLILAIGVFPQPMEQKGRDVRVVFMMGLPEVDDANDSLLIRVYDEIISITHDSELLQKIAEADSFQTLLNVLYKEAT